MPATKPEQKSPLTCPEARLPKLEKRQTSYGQSCSMSIDGCLALERLREV